MDFFFRTQSKKTLEELLDRAIDKQEAVEKISENAEWDYEDLDAHIASDRFQTVEDGMWDTYSLNWDKETCMRDLDPEKAKILQELAWEYVQKYSRVF